MPKHRKIYFTTLHFKAFVKPCNKLPMASFVPFRLYQGGVVGQGVLAKIEA